MDSVKQFAIGLMAHELFKVAEVVNDELDLYLIEKTDIEKVRTSLYEKFSPAIVDKTINDLVCSSPTTSILKGLYFLNKDCVKSNKYYMENYCDN